MTNELVKASERSRALFSADKLARYIVCLTTQSFLFCCGLLFPLFIVVFFRVCVFIAHLTHAYTYAFPTIFLSLQPEPSSIADSTGQQPLTTCPLYVCMFVCLFVCLFVCTRT